MAILSPTRANSAAGFSSYVYSPKVNGEKSVVGGMIVDKTVKYTKTNQVMAFLTLEDLLGTVEVVIFPRDYEKNRQ